MVAILRIGRKKPAADANLRDAAGAGSGGEQRDVRKEFIERLVKLIPSEVVALYLAGKGAIQSGFDPKVPLAADSGEANYWIGWSLFCLVAVILTRWWATRDKDAGLPAQKGAVFIAAVSFLIWIYTLGDVFSRVLPDYWSPVFGTLAVLVWTFCVPFFYKGDDA